MRKISVSFVLFSLLIGIFASKLFAHHVSFMDVKEDYHLKAEIDYLVEQQIVNGFEDGSFRPNAGITKAQAASILVRALKLNRNNHPKFRFLDVTEEHYAYNEIAKTVAHGIFPSEEKFSPNAIMTRESVAYAFVEAFNLEGTDSYQFSDVPSTSTSYSVISKLVENDIIEVDSDSSFKPEEYVTRGEFAAYVARALDSDYLPNQYNIPFNMNPVYNAFRFALIDPIAAQDLFAPSSNFDLSKFSENVESIEIEELTEIGRFNGVTEFSATFKVKLKSNYEGPLTEGVNHLFFLINREGFMDYKIISVGTGQHLRNK